ncbi:MAG: hypothetical protein R2748_06065 [Bryobacterales bacterium]
MGAAFARTIDAAKYVISNTLDKVDWNAEIIRGDRLEEAVRQLKREPGEASSPGACSRSPWQLGLVDEYEFIVHPKLAGRGPTLFAGLSTPSTTSRPQAASTSPPAVAMQYKALGDSRPASQLTYSSSSRSS